MKRGTVFRCVLAVSVLLGGTACTATTSGAQPPPLTAVTTTPPTTTVTTAPPTTTQPATPTALVPADIHFAGGCLLSQPPAAAQYELSCDGQAGVRDAVWSVWDQTEADGTGIYPVNNCQPTCIDGKYTDYPVSIHFDSPVRTKCGMVWGNNVFSFRTKLPNGKQEIVLTVGPNDVLTC